MQVPHIPIATFTDPGTAAPNDRVIPVIISRDEF
jgi:hypothetical protein